MIAHLELDGDSIEVVTLLQPTSPLRRADHIVEAMQYYRDKRASAVVSVCETEHSPIWSNQLPEDFSLSEFLPKQYLNKRSQDLPVFYRINGALYITDVKELKRQRKFMLEENSFAFLMDNMSSVDIDVELDFKLAELIMESG